MQIAAVEALEILDSKGTPTVEVTVTVDDGTQASAAVPSGASTGATEAVEVRDDDQDRYFGQGTQLAVAHVTGPLAAAIQGFEVTQQGQIDEALIEADQTELKSNLGGNAILGVSMAVCRAAAQTQGVELFQYFGRLIGNADFVLPQPMILLLEGGKHGNWATDIQEFMMVPRRESFPSFAEQLRAGAEVWHQLGKLLADKNYSTGVGFEGAYAPQEISSNDEAFKLIEQAVQAADYTLGEEIILAIDAASSEFYQDGKYLLRSEDNAQLSPPEWTQRLKKWMQQYPLWSIEDPYDQEAWADWAEFRANLEPYVQLVGDDLLTTNLKRIQRAIDERAVNSVLIKPNQIGTITETLQAIELSQQSQLATIISHRGGETNDDLIADLAVGTVARQCKFGGPDRGERLAKYNRLLHIEQQLQEMK